MSDQGWRIVTGTVGEQPEVPVCMVDIKAGDYTGSIRDVLAFSIQCGDDTVLVEPRESCQLLPQLRESGEYGELDGPLARACRSQAPGDHVEVALAGNVVHAGQKVSVLGRVAEETVAGAGYRDPARTVVVSVAAELIAVGEQSADVVRQWQQQQAEERERKQQRSAAAAQPREAKPQRVAKESRRRKRPAVLWLVPAYVPLVLGVGLLTAALVMTAVSGLGVTARALLAYALPNFGFAAFLWRRLDWFPEFATVGKRRSGRGVRWRTIGYWVAHLCLQSSAVIVIPIASAAPAFLIAVCVANACFVVICAIRVLRADQPGVRTAGHILSAESLTMAAEPGTSGVFEGTLSGAVRRRRNFSLGWKELSPDQHGNPRHINFMKWDETWSTVGELGIEVDGGRVELGLFGGELGAVRLDASPRLDIRRVDNCGFLEVSARDGDPVIALGRLTAGRNGPAMQATGPGALILFCTTPGTPARAELRRRRRHHYMGLAAMLLSVVAYAALLAV